MHEHVIVEHTVAAEYWTAPDRYEDGNISRSTYNGWVYVFYLYTTNIGHSAIFTMWAMWTNEKKLNTYAQRQQMDFTSIQIVLEIEHGTEKITSFNCRRPF